VNDNTLALDVIRDVGANGNFLVHRHTLEHLQSTQWRPELINRQGFDKWQAAGSTSLLGRAQKKLQQVLQAHQPIRIPTDKARLIQKCVDQFQ
jgi:trimethylamine--corrinoid protein Co-methyltransferase